MKEKSLTTFIIIWFGQLISLLGTKMTRFALLIWIYQQTGQATTMALLGFFSFGSMVIFSPIAGYWVDKLDRRRIMLWSDFGAGLVTVALLVFLTQGQLQLWHLYLGQTLVGIFDAFQMPAYTAASSTLIPKKHYGRMNGLRSLAVSVADVAAPMIAGASLVFVGLEGIMLFDTVTFLFAVISLTFVRIPSPISQSEPGEGETFWQQITFGLRYILKRDGLIGLLVVMSIINLFASFTYYGVFPAMVLARTDGSEFALGAVEAALGFGGIIGSILMSIWGGPKRKIHGVLAYTGLSFIMGDFLFGIGRSVEVWVFSGIAAAAFIPFITGCNLAIWQTKVPQHMQGRVLNVQYAIRYAMIPIGYILGGLLADYFFEPAMMHGAWLAGSFGWLVGTGQGAGMALMFIITGIGGTLTGFGGYFFTALRNVEEDLPDYDAVPVAAQTI
jgi:MFS family permease